MAAKWGNHEAGYRELEPAISKYSAKAVKAQVAAFLQEYKGVEDFQDKLPAA